MSIKPPLDIADHTLTVDAVINLLPLMSEARRLEECLINGGALHIILEDGNYEDSHVQHCIDFIKSGEYAKKDWCDAKEVDAQLKFAYALFALSEEQREMVCERKTVTEELFDLVMNPNVD